MANLTLASDIFALAASAYATFVLRHILSYFFAGVVPGWDELGKTKQQRVAVEMATLPARIFTGFVIFPVVVTAFTPVQTWRPKDTHICLFACSITTGAYLMDFTVPRSSKLSKVHNCMPLALLVMLRVFVSTGTPADALMCRSIATLLFFDASVGGIATVGLTFCFHCRDAWARSTSTEPLKNGYRAYKALLVVLSVVTMIGHYYSAMFMHCWFVEAYGRFGAWVYVLFLWMLLDLLLEVWFMWWFHTYEPRYKAKVKQRSSGVVTTPANTLELPRGRVMGLRGVFGTWLIFILCYVWRSVCDHASRL